MNAKRRIRDGGIDWEHLDLCISVFHFYNGTPSTQLLLVFVVEFNVSSQESGLPPSQKAPIG